MGALCGTGVTCHPASAIPRCPCVWALCHGPGDGRYPAGHRLPCALLLDCLQAQLHTAGHPLRCQPLHHPGHLLGRGQARHPLRQVCAGGETCTAMPIILPHPNCTLPSPHRKTFPSQHATLSAFAAVYVSVSSRHCPALCPTCTGSGAARAPCHQAAASPSHRHPPSHAQASSAQHTCVPMLGCGQVHTHVHSFSPMHAQALAVPCIPKSSLHGQGLGRGKAAVL